MLAAQHRALVVLVFVVTFALSQHCSSGWVPTPATEECKNIALSQSANTPLSCTTPVARTASGYCACSSGETVPSRGCVHGAYLCEERCQMLAEQRYVMDLGAAHMGTTSAVFVTVVCTGTADSLANARGLVWKTARMFKQYIVVMQLCGTLKDLDLSTKQEAQEWQADFKDKLVMHNFVFGRNKPSSTSDFSRLRNNYLLMIRLQFPEFQYLVVLDSHTHGIDFSRSALSHTFGFKALEHTTTTTGPSGRREYKHYLIQKLQNWDVMCSNAISVSRQERFADAANYRDYFFTNLNFEDHHNVVHDPLDPPDLVESCYGGLAVYNITSLNEAECAYAENEISEHIPFHRCLKKSDLVLWFNPNQIVAFP